MEINNATKKTEEKEVLEKIVEISEEFLQSSSAELNYQKITDTILDISGARYAAFNLYNEDGSKFTTVALSGPGAIIKKISSLFGFKLLGKVWKNDPVYAEKIKSYSTIQFLSAGEYSESLISKPVALLMEKTLNLGEIGLIKILKDNILVGNFILGISKNGLLKNKDFIEIYTRQVGLLITRIRSELKLIESEKELRNVFSSISDPLFVFDQETGSILDVNDRACSLYGYSRDEILKLKASDMSAEPEATRDSMKNFTTFVPVRYHKKKDGTVFTVEVTASLFKLNGRNVITASMRDFTDRKKAEQTLCESEERYKLLSEQSRIFTWEVDEKGLYTFADYVVEIILGYRPEDLVYKKHFYDLCPAEEREALKRDAFGVFKRKEQFLNLENMAMSKDGQIVWLSTNGIPILKDDGTLLGYRGADTDITERKKIEEALQASEEKFAKAFHSSPWAVTITNLDNGELIEVNKSFTNILGYNREEAIGRTTLELNIWIKQKDREEFIGSLKKDGFVYNKELDLRSKDGGIVSLIVSAELINLAGKSHMLSSFYNITERKKAEEKLKNSQLLLQSGIESPKEMIIFAIGKDYNYLFFNQVHKYSMMFSYGKEIEIGMNMLDYMALEIDKINAKNNFDRALNGEAHSTIQEYGEKVRSCYESFYSPIINEYNEIIGATAFARDITERKNRENEILHLSYHDKLTELYNRRFVEEEINRLDTKRQLPLSIIMGDLNSLKLTNDTFGHITGDTVLKEAAGLFKKICRSYDILARWGGDEFVILLPKTTIGTAEDIVARIKKECSGLVINNIPLGISVGIASKTEESQDIDKIIIEAESNMYKNKLVEKESSASSIIFALEQALYEKSSETLEHALRIKDNAVKLGKSAKLHSNQLDELSLLASLHDIGKVAIPETILLKKGKPTDEEWTVIKRHPGIGFNIAASSPQIVHIAKLIVACHENWDGSGYPKGLKGEKIPIVSRIIFICDAYDVMTSERIYKKTMSEEEAIKELKRCAGTQFDPVLVEKFIEIVST